MKQHQLISTLAVALLCLAQGSAMAQPGRGNNGNGNGNNSRCGNGDQGCAREHGRDMGQDNRQYQGRSHGEGEGAGPGHSFYRGDRLPNDYRARQYVVDDWHDHGLRSPPRGYHWVQTGSDYVLVAITTGVILELLLNH